MQPAAIAKTITVRNSPSTEYKTEATVATSIPTETPAIARYSETQLQHGGAVRGLARTAADSFNIYGGRRSDGSNDRRPEGQFQNVDLRPL